MIKTAIGTLAATLDAALGAAAGLATWTSASGRSVGFDAYTEENDEGTGLVAFADEVRHALAFSLDDIPVGATITSATLECSHPTVRFRRASPATRAMEWLS